jgi:ribosomal peptide maturation radical SAM protein 1
MGLELLRSFDWIDYVVHGEAEQSFPRLLEAIESNNPFDRLPGVSARRGSQVISGFSDAQPLADMNDSPLPDYTDYFQEFERHQLGNKVRVWLPIESSRGCWWGAKHHCTFCGLNGSTMSFRKKSAPRVYEEIMTLSKRYRCLTFNAVDNIMDMSYLRDLLPNLARADIDLSFFYEVKANLSREQVRLLAAAGVNSIQPGIESFSTDLLRLMRKGVTGIQNIQFLKWCYEFGVDPLWNILYAFPGEERRHYEGYPRFLRMLFHLRPPAGVFPIIFERFSPYHSDPEKFNIQIKPSAEYHMLYPESVVDMKKLAYYFEGYWEGQAESPDDYIQPVVDAHKEWMSHWQEKKIVFHYEKGPGFLTIYDNRPWRDGADLRMRRLTLNELQSRVYLFCDENHSFSAIRKMLLADFRSPPNEVQTEKLLDQFVEQGLMLREGDRYLSLAVRKAPPRGQLSQAAKSEQRLEMALPVITQGVALEGRSLPVLD